MGFFVAIGKWITLWDRWQEKRIKKARDEGRPSPYPQSPRSPDRF